DDIRYPLVTGVQTCALPILIAVPAVGAVGLVVDAVDAGVLVDAGGDHPDLEVLRDAAGLLQLLDEGGQLAGDALLLLAHRVAVRSEERRVGTTRGCGGRRGV